MSATRRVSHATRTPALWIAAGTLLLLGLALVPPADATHFRGGSLHATPMPNPSPTTAWNWTFGGWQAYRLGYFPPLNVGDVVQFRARSDGPEIRSGDGGLIPMALQVVAVNPLEDWFLANIVTGPGTPPPCPDCLQAPDQEAPAQQAPGNGQGGAPAQAAPGCGTCDDPVVSSTLPAGYPGSYRYGPHGGSPHWTACCRLGNVTINKHLNNPNGGIDLRGWFETQSSNAPPRSLLPPIVQCMAGQVCSFPVPAVDPEGDVLRFALSSSYMAGGTHWYGGQQPFRHPGPVQAPHALTIDPNTGWVTWDTAGAPLAPTGSRTFYSVQVTITASQRLIGPNGPSAGPPTGATPVDFLIQLLPAVTDAPRFLPLCSLDTVLRTGTPWEHRFALESPLAGVKVSLMHLGLPDGITLQVEDRGNRSEAVVRMSPTEQHLGRHLVVILGTDERGYQAPFCVLSLWVRTPNRPPLLEAIPIRAVEAGTQLSFTVRATDPDEDWPLTYSAVRLPEGSSFDAATRTFTWRTTLLGTHEHLLFDVQDPYGLRDQREATVMVFDRLPDQDRDGVHDFADVCPEVPNNDQVDQDADQMGDACDADPCEPGKERSAEPMAPRTCDKAASAPNAPAPAARPPPDRDADGVPDGLDNCPDLPYDERDDGDLDGIGNPCDADVDGDGMAQDGPGIRDNCPYVPNPGQSDLDADGLGDLCDAPEPGGQALQASPCPAPCPRAPAAQARPAPGLALLGLLAGLGLAALAGRPRPPRLG